MDMKVVALAGGVGGAKLAQGLAACLEPANLTVIVNTADDFVHLGLQISPDLDTVMYTLAGIANPQLGWGRADESWHFMETLEAFGGPVWFRLGDRDLALHHWRTSRRIAGEALSALTLEAKNKLGISVQILPMSDDQVQTIVSTSEGALSFQEYFVARKCEPAVRGFHFEGIETAEPAPGTLESLETADVVIFCPSNPWVSLDPILAVRGIRDQVRSKPVFMVSPIIAGKAVKGPAAKMYAELGVEPSAVAVAQHYEDILLGLMVDHHDASLVPELEALGLKVCIEDTLMKARDDRIRIAQSLLEFAQTTGLKERTS